MGIGHARLKSDLPFLLANAWDSDQRLPVDSITDSSAEFGRKTLLQIILTLTKSCQPLSPLDVAPEGLVRFLSQAFHRAHVVFDPSISHSPVAANQPFSHHRRVHFPFSVHGVNVFLNSVCTMGVNKGDMVHVLLHVGLIHPIQDLKFDVS